MADRRRLGVQDALWLEMNRPNITNVRRPPMPVYLAGSKAEAMAGWVPISGNQAMSFTIYSYDGKVTVGIACDMGPMPRPSSRPWRHPLNPISGATRSSALRSSAGTKLVKSPVRQYTSTRLRASPGSTNGGHGKDLWHLWRCCLRPHGENVSLKRRGWPTHRFG